MEVADPTFYLTQAQYTDTRTTHPSADPIMPGAWQGSHCSAKVLVTGMTGPGKILVQGGIKPTLATLETDALPSGHCLPLSRRMPYRQTHVCHSRDRCLTVRPMSATLAGMGCPGVRILCLGEIESWICNFHLSVRWTSECAQKRKAALDWWSCAMSLLHLSGQGCG